MPNDNNRPKTVDEAVDYLLADLSLNEEIIITAMGKEDLPTLHFSLGTYIRNEFGFWSENEALMESCRQCSGINDLNADDASAVIIQALWEKLQSRDDMGLRDDGSITITK